MKAKLCAFTLAEVLITLAVIGVVAVLAIGIFMPKIQDRVLAAQVKTAKIKFTKAMEQMALNNKIGPLYQDTEEFVSELGNYLKLAKVCDNDKLADCFGYETLVDADGEEFNLSDAADGSVFNMPENNANDFTGNTKGIVTIDGVPMVLAWNKKCEILEPGVYQWGNNTNISTSCVAALMDVNGTKRPDKLGKDIILLNASNIGACIKFTYGGTTYKWGCPFEPQPLSYNECMALVERGVIQACASNTGCTYGSGSACYLTADDFWNTGGGDRWAGAVQQCGGKDKMISNQDLSALAYYLYDEDDSPSFYFNIGLTHINKDKLARLNTTLYEIFLTNAQTFSGGYLNLWSNYEYSNVYAYRGFFMNEQGTDSLTYRYAAQIPAVCKL